GLEEGSEDPVSHEHRKTRHFPPRPSAPTNPADGLAKAALLGAQPAATSALAVEGSVVRLFEAFHRDGGRGGGLRDERTRRTGWRLVVGVVDAQASAAQLESVVTTDGVGRARGIAELGEREASRPARYAILPEPHPHGGIDLGEHRVELFFGGVEGQVADENRG